MGVADQLRLQIVQGQLAPDQRLPAVSAMAQAFRVSIPTMHAALAALTFAGLLRAEHGVGTFVARADQIELLPLALGRATPAERHALRLDLEIGAARRAARRRTDRDLHRLWVAASELQLARISRDPWWIARTDLEFHRRVVQAAHHPLLTYLVLTLSHGLVDELAGRIGHALREQDLASRHQVILDAVEAGRPDAAASAVARVLAAEAPEPQTPEGAPPSRASSRF